MPMSGSDNPACRAGDDGCTRDLAPAVGSGDDAVVDGGAEGWFEAIGGFGIEGAHFVVANQPPLFEQDAVKAGRLCW